MPAARLNSQAADHRCDFLLIFLDHHPLGEFVVDEPYDWKSLSLRHCLVVYLQIWSAGHVRQKPDSCWEALSNVHGECRYITGRKGETDADVQKRLNEALHNLDRGIETPKDNRQTLGEYLDRWLLMKKPSLEYSYWKRSETGLYISTSNRRSAGFPSPSSPHSRSSICTLKSSSWGEGTQHRRQDPHRAAQSAGRCAQERSHRP
jgi:hypothetical protein